MPKFWLGVGAGLFPAMLGALMATMPMYPSTPAEGVALLATLVALLTGSVVCWRAGLFS